MLHFQYPPRLRRWLVRNPDLKKDAPIRNARDLGFEPTSAQARAKAQFWRKFREDPVMEPAHVGPSDVRRLIECGEIDAWWVQPNFRPWFLHQDAWRDSAQ